MSGAARGAKATEAKQICGGCPVREECLEYALKTRPRIECERGHADGDLFPGRYREWGDL